MLETLEEDWDSPPRKRIRKAGLLRILKKPYELPRHPELYRSTDNYLMDDVGGATPFIKLSWLLEHPEVEYPSIGVAYYPYAD